MIKTEKYVFEKSKYDELMSVFHSARLTSDKINHGIAIECLFYAYMALRDAPCRLAVLPGTDTKTTDLLNVKLIHGCPIDIDAYNIAWREIDLAVKHHGNDADLPRLKQIKALIETAKKQTSDLISSAEYKVR